MFKLLNSILEGKEKDITESELEKSVKAGQGTISHAKDKGTDLSFMFLLRTVKLLDPQNEVSLMKKFISKFTNLKNLRIALEYALSNQDFELCRELIERNKALGRENKDWAEVYEVLIHTQERKIPQSEIFQLIDDASPKYLETRVLLNIMKCYKLFHIKRWTDLIEVSKVIENDIKNIKNEYIRNIFTCRFYHYLAHTKLHYYNEPSVAREYANYILECEFTTFPRLHINNLLGSTYILEDYKKSLGYFEKYIQEMRNVGLLQSADNVQNMDIAFLRNYWEIGLFELQTNDLAEIAHNYVKRGEVEKANEIFDELEQSRENGLSPFQKYYKGMGNNDPKLLFESLVDFMVIGDRYYASMVKDVLQKYEVYSHTSETVYNKF